MLNVLAQFAIIPFHSLENENPAEIHNSTFWSEPITSGMFAFDKLEIGNYFSLKLNPFYEGQTPKITKVVNYFVSDILTAAQSNLLDYISLSSPVEIAELNKMENLTKYPVDTLFYVYLIFNMSGVDGNQNEPMQDVLVREAIATAIDRDEIIKLFANAKPINSGVPNSYSAYNNFKYEYNPDKAIELLNQAKWNWNTPVRILYYAASWTDMVDAIVYYLQNIGLKAESILTDKGTEDLFFTRNYDIAVKGLSAFSITEWYNEFLPTSNTFKNIFGGNPLFKHAIEKLGSATETDKLNRALIELQELEQNNMWKIPLYARDTYVYLSEKVSVPEGIEFSSQYYKSNNHFVDWDIK